ncbi:hypothetical protein QAD02_001178 [Eretmocerus hayati]|uniref:Uncharacterized protein n=1 Tax=Eretmocerus hayati TaxID=131215 RepID=A0ACC2NHX7_9HYME|nr:hypothetical protein QAD02_001178 [Eretmocerus hayati]
MDPNNDQNMERNEGFDEHHHDQFYVAVTKFGKKLSSNPVKDIQIEQVVPDDQVLVIGHRIPVISTRDRFYVAVTKFGKKLSSNPVKDIQIEQVVPDDQVLVIGHRIPVISTRGEPSNIYGLPSA